MKAISAGSTSWASGEPPSIRGPWESAIIGLAEKGDPRFIDILRKHVRNRVIRSERAMRALGEGVCVAVSAEG